MASPGDTIGNVTAATATTYTQPDTRSDGTVSTTYTLGGTGLTQGSPAVSTMPQHASNALIYSPNSVNTADVASLSETSTGCNAGTTLTDCGTKGTLTIGFDKPVTNPTLHVVGLGGYANNINYGTYFDITGAQTIGGATATATFAGTPLTTGSGLSITKTNTRLATSATKPGVNCADATPTQANGVSGCGSVVIQGTNLTSVTLGTGLLAIGASVLGTNLTATNVDAFDLTTTVPATPPFLLSLTKANPSGLKTNNPANYTLTVTNSGPGVAPGATVTDTLPPNVVYTSASGTNWTCSATGAVATGQTVTCTLAGNIASGGQSVLTIRATPNSAAVNTTVRNVASVDPTGQAAPPAPNTCTANGSPAGCAYPASQTVASVPLTCAPGDVYSLDGTDHNFFDTSPTDGTQTLVGNIGATTGTAVNALGITNGTGVAWATSGSASNGAKPTVYSYDPTTNTTSTFTGPTLTDTTTTTATTIVAGAVNPANGIYYFGFITTNAGVQQLELYGFDTVADTPVTGRIAVVTLPSNNGGANGDIVFDRLGRMFFLATTGNNTATGNPLLAVNGLPGATGSNTALTSKVIANLSPLNATFNGLAFDLPSGYLLATGRDSNGNSFIEKINPSSGAQIATYPLASSGTQVVDAASCNYNNSLSAQKNIVNRAATGDQFTVSISDGGLASPQTATTVGSTTGLQSSTDSTAGPVVTVPGSSYTVSEAAAGTTNLGNYTSTYSCTNLLDGTTLASGTGTTFSLPFPTPTTSDGTPVNCVFTNSAYLLSLTKTNPVSLVAGQPAAYTFAVKNSGKAAAPTATVVDKLPANVAYTSFAGAGWTCSASGTVAAGQTVTCTFTGSIAAGATNSALAITVAPNASASRATVRNVASVAPDGGTNPVDPATCTANDNPAGCAYPASQTVGTGITLGLAKSAPSPAFVVGYPSTYTLTLTNSGVNAASGATVREALPANTQYTSAAGATCSVTGGTTASGQLLTCTVPSATTIAASGGTASFTVSVVPLAASAGTSLVNKAAVDVSGGTAAGDPATCTATGTPAGCALSPAATPVADVVRGPSPSYTTTVGVAIASVDVKTATTSAQSKTIGNPTIATQPANGTASVNADGTLKYVPNAGFSGADPFTYTICNTGTPAACDTETVSIVVSNVFTPGGPIATAQNTSVTSALNAIATVTGKPLDPTRVTQVTAPVHGSLSISTTSGAVTYTPAAGYTGTDSYVVQVCDTSSPVQCTNVTKSVTVGANTVTAVNDTASTSPATAVIINVRANDTSQTGQPLANPTITTAPTRGTATVNANGTVTYTPTSGKSGSDTFIYRVCDTSNPTPVCSTATVTVSVTNTVTAVNDTSTTPQNTSVATNVLANDTVSPGGSPLDPATVAVMAAPAHGTTSVNTTTGVVTYTPASGYSGTDSYRYQVCDTSQPTASCASATVSLTVTANAVTAVNDTATTTPGVSVSTDVRANDTTTTGQPLANPTIATQPTKGTVAVDSATGRTVYTPTSGSSGVDTYRYQVCDTSNPTPVCSTATVTVTVANTVTAVDDSATTAQNTAVASNVTANDTVSANGAPVDKTSVSVTTAPAHGSTSVNTTTGVITYTPANGYTGTDTYKYRVCDTSTPTPTCSIANVTVSVGANTVSANPDSATTTPVTAVTTNVRANDTTSTGQALANPTIATNPGNGTATVNANGTITYTPQSGFSGVDTYRYQVCDTSTPTPVCSTTTVTVTVANTVTANDDIDSTPQNTAKATSVLGNDTISSGGAPLAPSSVTVTVAPVHGSTSVNTTTGVITYTPASGYTGTDTYKYRVCDTSTPTPTCATANVTITVGPNSVTAVNDTATTTPGTAVTTDVRTNDTSQTGQPLANPTVPTQPTKGTATVNANGTITYTPTNGTSGTDTYTYRVCDTSNPTPVCAQATVTVNVNNVVTAVNDTATTAQNTSVTTRVLDNDTVSANGAPLDKGSVAVITAPTHGSTSVDTATGIVTYTPSAGYTGADSYTYQVCDTSTPTTKCASAQVAITVGANTVVARDDSATTTPGTGIGIDVRANDTTTTGQPLANPTIVTQPSKGTATVSSSSGRVIYTPTNGTSGVDTLTYRVCDTSNPTPVCATATVTVTVTNAVTAANDTASTAQNTSVTTNVLSNDSVSTNGSPLNPASVTVTTPAAHGSTTVNTSTGAVTYTPNTGYTGSDSYVYQVCDSSTPTPVCSSATVAVNVGGNVVTASDDTTTTTPITAVTTDVRANDTTSTGQPLANPTIQTAPTKGTVSVDATTGKITYTPTSGKSGVDSYVYKVCDTTTPTAFCSTATVTVSVQNTISPTRDTLSVAQNTAGTADVLANDTVSPGGAPLNKGSVTIVQAPAHGTTSIDAVTGAITFTPSNGYTGTDGLTYQVCDTSTPTPTCARNNLAITVGANTVSATNDTATTPPVTAKKIDVRVNDTTSTGQSLANPTVTTAPGHGTTNVNTDGTISYTPASGFSGVDTFRYQVCDTSTPTPVCSSATVSVTVPNTVTARADTATTAQNTSVVTSVLANDTVAVGGAPLDPGTVAVTTSPTHGSTTVNTSTGAITYVPNAGYTGSDSYVYQVCDTSTPTPYCGSATVGVTVGANTVTARPDTATTQPGTAVIVNVRANDTSTSGQALAKPTITANPGKGAATVLADGTIRYLPNEGTSGTDVLTYQVCDTGSPAVCASAALTITVPNTVTVVDDSSTTAQNTNVTTPVLGNDTVTAHGAPLDPSSVTVTSAPAHGTTSVNTTTGAITFTPTHGYSGTDSYGYRVCDTSSPTPVCATATVSLSIGGNTVTAVNDSATTNPLTAVGIDVGANDSSSTGQALAVPTVTIPPNNGTTSVNATTGVVTYTPRSGFSGTDAFTYRVCDTSSPTPVCAFATATIAVTDVVTAQSDAATTAQNTAVTTQVLANDSVTAGAAPLDPSSVSVTTAAGHGSTSVDTTTGAITYTPATGFTGTDTYRYQVCDGSTPTPVCGTATVAVTVGGNTVVANNDSDSTTPGSPVTTDVRSNDTTATGQPLAIPTIRTAPTKGTATVNADGTITYTPTNGTSGTDTYGYRVCDTSSPTPVCANAAVTVTVANRVTAVADSASTAQNTAVTTRVLDNDTVSTNGAPLNPAAVTVTSAAAHGTTSVNTTTGAITYTPATGYSGSDSYSYQVCDRSTPTPVCATAVVSVTAGANTVAANDDSASTTPGTSVTTDVRANDSSATGLALAKPTVTTQPGKGTAAVNANGTITYTPTNGTSGADTYRYQVCDTSSPTPVCASATVTVTVADTVTARNDSATTAQNTAQTISVLDNDSVTTNGAPLNPASVTVTTAPTHGAATVNTVSGAITYTPANGYSGSDVLTYQVCDKSTPTPVCATASVSVTVGGNTVTAVADSATTTPGNPVTTNVRSNDTSASGQALAIPTIVTSPANGVLVVNSDGTITYTPTNGTSGTDSYSYQVCNSSNPTPACSRAAVTVSVRNTVTAVADSASTAQNTAVTTSVLANDRVRANGAPLDPSSVGVTTPAGHGTTTVDTATGAITYTPATGFSGSDTYSYRVCDGSTPTAVCDTATVSITVGGNTVSANPDSDSTTPGVAVTTNVLSNDSSGSGQPLTNPTIASNPTKGSASVNANGTITYTPTSGTSGADTYRYQVCDTSATPICATTTVTISVRNTVKTVQDSVAVPQNGTVTSPVLANDSVATDGAPLDPTSVTIMTAAGHGTTSVNATTGAVTYTPTAGFSGPDTYTYRVCDTSTPTAVCNTAPVVVTVGADVVTANADSITTTAGTPVTVDVRSNDTTSSGQSLARPTIVSQPTKGTAVVNADGSITFTPATGVSGTDSFSYQVCDTGAPPACSTTTATATVSVVNTVTARNDSASAQQNRPVTTNVLANDTVSPGGSPLDPNSVTVTSGPAHGSTSVSSTTGAVTYTPAAGYSGADSYIYRVCDTSSPTPVCASATVSVTVGTNTVSAVNDSATTTPGNAVTTAVLANDTSGSGQPLGTPTVFTAPGKGTATVNTDGSITYTPADGTSGTDTYVYRICDTSVAPICANATVTISVPNQVTARNDSASTAQNTATTVAVLANDSSSPRGAPLDPSSVMVNTAPSNGTTSVNPTTGDVTYAPATGFSGTDTFGYFVCDGSTPSPVCSTATVTVTVGANTVTAVDDSASTVAGRTVVTDVRANDSTATGQPLAKPIITTQPASGTVTVSADGTIAYAPASGRTGTFTYRYRVCDTSTPTPVCDNAVVSVAVVNTVTANPDSVSVAQNGTAQTSVLANDTVSAGGAALDPASVTVTTVALHGTTSVNATTGAVTYTPTRGYTGADSYTYRVCDRSTPTPVCDTSTVTATVGANTVAATPDSASTTPGTAVTTNVRANDSSSTGQALDTPTLLTQPAHGTAVVNNDGTITYTPADGTSGSDSYTYQVCDTGTPAVCASATVTVAVTNTVTATADQATVQQNSSVTTVVTANDTVSPHGAPLDPSTLSVSTAPAHGSTSVDPTTGSVTYTPTPGYSGADSYRYQICDTSTPTAQCASGTVSVTVTPSSVSAGADTATTTPGDSVTTDVRANDSSSTGQRLGLPTIVSSPTKGAVSVAADGTITYTPTLGTSGTDSYSYRVCDTSATPICGQATVTVSVNNTVTAAGDSAAVAQNGSITTRVLDNDTVSPGGAALSPGSVRITVAPTHGSTTVDRTTGAVTYLPTTGYSGTDTYTYRVCDTSTPTPTCAGAAVTLSVGANSVVANDDSAATTPGNAVTVDVRSNDTSSTGQPLVNPTISAAPVKGSAVVTGTGTITYTPRAGTSGTDSFTYRVCDASTPTPVCGTATVTVSVSNRVTATSDAVTVAQNGSVTTNVLANDTVSTGGAALDPTSVTVPVAPAHGTVSIDPTTGAVTFVPTAGYSGTDSYTYRVCDTSTPTPVCDRGTASVSVSADTLTVTPDTVQTVPGVTTTTDVRADDTTSSNQPLATPTIVAAPAKGSVVVNPNGTISYTPAAGSSGADSFTYQVCDTGTPAVCGTAPVNVTVANTVTAGADTVAVAQNDSVTTNVLANDIVSPGGAPLDPASVTISSAPTNGTATVNATTGRISYTPTPGFSGTDSYSYRVCDGSTPTPTCAGATVTLDVGNNTVSANDDSASTVPGTSVVTNVRANDSSATGQPLGDPTITVAPTKGRATVGGNGSITYVPADGTSGTDSYTYRICDTSTPAVCDTAMVTVRVTNTLTVPDQSISVTQNHTSGTDALAGASVSPHGAPLDPTSVSVLTGPAHGTATADPRTGVITYNPDPDYVGADTFTYQVCDTSTPAPTCATATISVSVTAGVVTAAAESPTSAPGSPVTTDVIADATSTTGHPIDPSSVEVVTPARHGTAVIDPTTGAITYAPDDGFSGTDSYDYQICDSSPTPVCATATVTISVPSTVTATGDVAATPQNTAVQTDVLANDTTTAHGAPLDPGSVTVTRAPAHGSTTVDPSAGAITYTPTRGYTGADSYVYQVCDTSTPTPVCASTTVGLTVGANAVAAGNDSATTAPGTAVTIDELANDSSGTGQPFSTPTITAAPAKGTVVVNDDDTITYTPRSGTSGTDTFTYRVCDTSSPTPVCAGATVTVTVPSAVAAHMDTARTPQGTRVTTRVIDNDTVTRNGAPLDPASVSVRTAPTHGTVRVNGTTGAIKYTPDATYSGPDSYTYRVCDTSTPTPVCDTATVAVIVNANVVTARPDTSRTATDSAVVTRVLIDDTTRDGGAPLDPSSLRVLSKARHGSTIIDPVKGTITYTPDAGFSGKDRYTYQVCDTSTPTPVCDTSTVTISVVAPTGALRVLKSGSLISTAAAVGGKVHWLIKVTNVGATALRNVVVTDPKAGAVTCPKTALAVGASETCTVVDQTVTAAEMAAGSTSNTAEARADSPSGPVYSAPATAVVKLTPGGSGTLGAGEGGTQSGGSTDGTTGSPDSSGADGLSDTGTATLPYLIYALLALLAGLALLAMGRTRRRPGGVGRHRR